MVREVYEETGLHVRVDRVLAVVGGASCRVTYPNGHVVEYVVTVFGCTRLAGSLIDSNDETAALEWFLPDEMPTLVFTYPAAVLRGTEARPYFEWDEAWVGR
jgi:8-oxo-dGTP pyrophosphatase MutT (NUDIX family)